MSSFDIVVVGAGVVGLTAALAIAKKTSLQICLLESNSLQKNFELSENYHLRVSAISLASQRLLQRLNVWDSIAATRISPYEKMSVWEEQGNSKLEFDCSALQCKQLGWIIEDNVMRASLLEEVRKTKNIALHSNVVLQRLQKNSDSISLHSQDQVWETKLIIAADGAQSWVRNATNIVCHKKDYQQQAIVATVVTQQPHNKTAYQQFLKTGPLAFLPLQSAHQSSIVWSLANDVAEEMMSLDEKNFRQQIDKYFASTLGSVTEISERKILPLMLQQATTYLDENIVLVGDAAHTIHPLAGQGVNLGLLDVACLTDVISEALVKDRNFWSFANLRRYERNRKTENSFMLNFVDNIKKIFTVESVPMTTLKELGVNTVNKNGFLKTFFIQHAVGNKNSATLTRP